MRVGGKKNLNESHCPNNLTTENFGKWMGDVNCNDRKFSRKIVINYKPKTILDVRCGNCIEYYGFKNDFPDAEYTGIDITPKLVKQNKNNGINCIIGSLNNLPFKDNTFDAVYNRHIVEHMESIEIPLAELIRVAKKIVLIAFFIGPSNNDAHLINLYTRGKYKGVYHNNYSKKLIETALIRDV